MHVPGLLLALTCLAFAPVATAVDAWVYYGDGSGGCTVGWSLSGGPCKFGEGGPSAGGVSAGVDAGVFAVCVNDNDPGVGAECAHELLKILALVLDGGPNLSSPAALPLA